MRKTTVPKVVKPTPPPPEKTTERPSVTKSKPDAVPRESVTELKANKTSNTTHARKHEGRLAINKTATLRTGWLTDCSVKVDGGLLHYVQKDKNEAGTIILQNSQVVRSVRDETRFFFMVRTAKEVVWFEARDNNTLTTWIECCRDHGATLYIPTIEGVMSLIQTTLLSKKLTEKWFVLMGNKIEYFADQYACNVEGSLPLPACAVVTGHDDLRLEVAETGDDGAKSVSIQAKTDQVLAHWVEALRTYLSTQDSRVNRHSIKEGYLGDGTAKNKKMYYILTEGMLQYYKNRNDEKEVGRVLVDGGSVCQAMTGPGFSLAASGDEDETKILMFAANVDERVSWVATIMSVIKKKPEHLHDSLREGYLFGATKKGAWKKRYVVLLKTRLQYYKKRSDSQPEGEVTLSDGGCVNQESEVNCLSVAASGDEGETSFYYLVAADQTQCQTWLDSIKNILIFTPTNVNSLKEDYFDVGWDSKKMLRRYCVLLPNSFQVFRSRKDKQHTFEVELDGGSICTQTNEEQQNLFYIASNRDKECKRLYVLHKREHDTVSWIAAILQLISSKDYRANKDSIHEDYLLFQTGLFKKWMQGYCVILSDRLVCFSCKDDVVKRKEEISHVFLPSGGKIIPYNSDQATDSKTWGFSILQSQDAGEETKGVNFAAETNKGYLDFVAALNVVLKANYTPIFPLSLKESYLSCGHKKTNLKWRHVILLQEKLLYYSRRNDNKPSGEILLPGGAENVLWGDLGFIVASSGDEGEQPFYLQAADAKERQDWVSEINQVIQGKSAKVQPNSRREGYLQVGSKKAGGFQKRYTILMEGALQYFKSRNDVEPLGSVRLGGGAVAELQDEGVGYVAASGDTSEKSFVYFVCEQNHPQDTKTWIDDITQILSSKDSKLDPLSFKEGYLQAGQSLQTMKRQYVVITSEKIIVYKSRAVTAKDCVEFSLNTEWTASEWKMTFINLVFNIRGGAGDSYYFEASSEEEREQWMAVLEELMFRDSRTDPESINEGFVMLDDFGEYRKVFAVLTPRALTLFESRGKDRVLSLALDEGTNLDSSPSDPSSLVFLGPAGAKVVLKFRLRDTKLEWHSNIINVLEERGEVAKRKKEKMRALILQMEEEEQEAERQREKAELERRRIAQEEAQAFKVAELERRSKEMAMERQLLEERSKLAEGLQRTLQQERAAVEEAARLEQARLQAEARAKAEEQKAELRRKQEKERKEAEIKRKEQEEKRKELEEKRKEEEHKRKEAVAEQRRKELKAKELKAKELANKKEIEEKDGVKKPVKSRIDTGLRTSKPKPETTTATGSNEEGEEATYEGGEGGEEADESLSTKTNKPTKTEEVKKPVKSRVDTGLTKNVTTTRVSARSTSTAPTTATATLVVVSSSTPRDSSNSTGTADNDSFIQDELSGGERESGNGLGVEEGSGTGEKRDSTSGRVESEDDNKEREEVREEPLPKSIELEPPRKYSVKTISPKPKPSPVSGTRAPLASTCDLCEDARSSVWCNECKMQLCGADGQNCDDDMHKVTSRARHVRVPVIEEVVKDFSTILWCYLCGQKFTSASLGFHLTQCPVTRKLSLRELPKELRPPIPSAPGVPIPTEEDGKEAYAAYNKEAQEIFRDHMPCCPYPGCRRKFAPESIQKHMRGCRYKNS